jgi:hypothetical protein
MNTENKLPEDFKQRWVAALRSGQYEQGTQVLCDSENGPVCCLAVAGLVCGLTRDEMQRQTMVPLMEADGMPSHKLNLLNRANEVGYPKMLREGVDGLMSIGGKLARMNDGCDGERKHSFSEIADWIEQNL